MTKQPAKRGGSPKGLLGALALVVMIEAFVARHDLDLLDASTWQYRLVGPQTAAHALGRDVLCFGDSLTKVSVLPQVVQARSGLRVYNLAMLASQVPAHYHVLRRAIEGGARPVAVILAFHPMLLARGPDRNRAQWAYMLSLREAIELGLKARDASLLGDIVFGAIFPSVRGRHGARPWIFSALKGRESEVRSKTPTYLRHWFRNDGAQVMPAIDRPVDAAMVQRYMYPSRWTCDRVNADYLRRFLELARDHRIVVYWLIPPVDPELQRVKECAGFDSSYANFIQKWQRQFPNVVAIDGRYLGLGHESFMDADHLGRPGAIAWSIALGDSLRRLRSSRPPADRWIRLARSKTRVPDVAISDVLSELEAVGIPVDIPASLRR